ncbi:TetR/AcrR family transcriptional regulator [Nocardia rhamnosiphila]|uniref:TetR/AcrR family transcriptional regulator n=1 Tax=Nocardia rhamnosiphila TaxID=426716 RepID=UPI0033CFDBA1
MGEIQTNRKALLTNSATTVVADQGLRGLTHRAVDRAAGLPSGTCSYHLPTRQALLSAMLDAIAASETAEIDAVLAGRRLMELPVEERISRTTSLLLHWLGPARARSRVRLLLMLDAPSRELVELSATAFTAGFHTLAFRELADSDLAGLMIALLDGLLVSELTEGRTPVDPDRLRGRISAIITGLLPEPGENRGPRALVEGTPPAPQ